MENNTVNYLGINIDYSRDSNFKPHAIDMLMNFYAMKHEKSPQESFARACVAWSKYRGETDFAMAQRLYDAVSNKHFMFASPVLSNAPQEGYKVRGLPISCFLGYVPDTIPGLISHSSELRWLSVMGGGVGGHWSDVRSISDIAPGPIPFIHTVDSDMGAYKQGSCYSPDTEILTDSGWKRFDQLQGSELVAQVTEDYIVEFVKPLEFVKEYHEGVLLNIKDKKSVNIKVTPNHSMVISRKTITGWQPPTKIRADLLPKHCEVGMTFSGYSGVIGDGLTDSEKLSIAYQADGYLESGGSISFHSFKPRKREQMLKLLENTKWSFNTNYSTDTSTTIRIKLKGSMYLPSVELSKDFSWVKPHTRSLLWCEEFLEQVRLWDSSDRGDNTNSFIYCNTNKEAAEIVFTVATLAGKQVRIKEDIRDENRKNIFHVYISDTNHFTTQKVEEVTIPYSGFVYCTEVPSGMLLVRSNGKSLICGNTRKGSYAAYLDVTHPDIIEFMNIRVPTGDENRKAFAIHNAVNVPDSFMEAVLANEKYQLIDPKVGPTGTWLDARKVWEQLLEIRFRTGEPYIHFITTANRALPQSQKDLGLKINGSNLCIEIELATNELRTAVCCLSSLNVELQAEWPSTLIHDLMTMLDNVLEYFIETAPESLSRAVYSASRERAVGLGAMGFHSLLQSHSVAFDSDSAKVMNKHLFSFIKTEVDKSNFKLGKTRGEAPDMVGTGKRFSHGTALAPNASSGLIIGTSPSIEAEEAVAYVHRTRAGSFLIKNRYFEDILERYGKNIDEIWTGIITNEGSVQHLGFLTDHEKAVFKTSREINQLAVVEMAGDRAPLLDQGQSVNLHFESGVDRAHVNKVHITAWKRGVKGLYYLRSKSKQRAESVSTKVKENKLEDNEGTIIYGKPNCPYCERAKKLFDLRGIEYEYVDIIALGKTAAEVTGRPDVRSLPQIYIDGEYIGGYDAAYAKLTAFDEDEEVIPALDSEVELNKIRMAEQVIFDASENCRACEG